MENCGGVLGGVNSPRNRPATLHCHIHSHNNNIMYTWSLVQAHNILVLLSAYETLSDTYDDDDDDMAKLSPFSPVPTLTATLLLLETELEERM